MIGWTTSLIIQVAFLSSFNSPYQEAFDQAEKEGKPLLVLVGADWCPGCRTMKDEKIPELERDGGLEQVVFATVNTDEKPELSKRLLRGNSIPQLVLFVHNGEGWRRFQLTGVHEPGSIRQFIRKQVARARAGSDESSASDDGT